MMLRNFGRNLQFSPEQYFTPANAEEVLRILESVRGKKIRAIGALHSWSEAPCERDVILNMEKLDAVEVQHREGEPWAIVGAGCRLKRAIEELDRQGLALPTHGLISEQAIAGAAATGTHGSGRHSLSHYVDEMTIAHYDQASGQAKLTTLRDRDDLRTARCALGCLGVVVSIGIRCRRRYNVEEHFRVVEDLRTVIEAEAEYPLQQFFLLPYVWKYLVQHRRETAAPRSRRAALYQVYWYVGIDLGLHLMLLALVRVLQSPRLVRLFYRYVAPSAIVRGWRVVDNSPRILMMEHELFRHIEIELFVRGERLAEMLDFLQCLLCHCAGEPVAQNNWFDEARRLLGGERFEQLASRYQHHYPICVRKVLADDTTLSMASGVDGPYYAVSLISYASQGQRAGFFAFADALAKVTAHVFDARPHWGKICPIDAATVARLYPGLDEFREVCHHMDPERVFTNDWLAGLLFNEVQTEG